MPGQVATKTIGDTKYSMEPLPFGEAGDVFLRVGKPLLDLLKAKDRDTFIDAVIATVRGMNADDLRFVSATLAAVSKFELRDPNPRNGARWLDMGQQYNEHFRGRFEKGLQWILWGLEVNYGPFVDAARAMFLQSGTPSKSAPPPTEDSGPSGDSSSAAA